jgi:uncharacterized protein
LPGSAFKKVVPILILFAVVLVLIQPTVARRRAERGAKAEHPGRLLQGGTLLVSVYGGYFGAAQGVILLGLLATFLAEDLQRVNAVKNVLAGVVNATAAILFILIAHVNWAIVVCIAVGSTLGGLMGASIGRRLPPMALRILIVVVGVIAIIKLV